MKLYLLDLFKGPVSRTSPSSAVDAKVFWQGLLEWHDLIVYVDGNVEPIYILYKTMIFVIYIYIYIAGCLVHFEEASDGQ